MIRIEQLLVALGLAFVPYLVAVGVAPRLDWRRVRGWIIGVAIAARLVCLPLPFLLSDDVDRYLWEGQVQNAGFNPYRSAPDAPELARLRDNQVGHVSHPEVPTIYPPLLLLVFRGAAAVSSAPAVFKYVFAGFDLLTLWVLVRWLRARGQNESLALIWALNPLVIVEFAGSGHELSLAIFFFMLGMWALQGWKHGRLVAAVCFAAAILSHLMALPLVIAAALAARMRAWKFWAVLVGVVVLGYVPFAGAGWDLFRGALHFAGRWRHNGSVFDVLVWLLRDDTTRQVAGEVWLAFERTKLVSAAALAGVFGWVWWRRAEPPRTALTVAGALLLLSSTVHPWYVTWLVALAAGERRWSWLVWSGTVLLAYGGDTIGWRVAEYAPVGAVLIWESGRSMVRRRWSPGELKS